MGRPNIESLKRPKKKSDITRHNPHTNKNKRFETKEECQKEDKLRIKMNSKLEIDNDQMNMSISKKQVKLLNKKIKKSKTPASRVYMRKWRRNLINSINSLPIPEEDSLIFFTLIPRGFSFRGGRLSEANPAKLMERIRLMFMRNGSSDTEGWMFCYLHGEYERMSNQYVLHVHGVATSDYREVFKSMRSSCRVLQSNTNGDEPEVRKRIQISKKPIDNKFKVISYCTQSYWPMRNIFDNKKRKRERTKHRIINPYHTEYLLWLSKTNIKDMELRIGLVVNKNGKLIHHIKRT